MVNQTFDETLERKKLIESGALWGEILTREEKSRMDAYDVTILEMTRRRTLRTNDPADMSLVRRDVHIEMGGLTDVEFQAKVKKLEDMALLRRYITLNI